MLNILEKKLKTRYMQITGKSDQIPIVCKSHGILDLHEFYTLCKFINEHRLWENHVYYETL